MRRIMFSTVLMTLFIIFHSCQKPSKTNEKKATKPNVLFIAIDDLNDWIEPYDGHPQTKTPNLKDFSHRAMTFTNAHASAPLCNPSRVSLLTGLDPRNTGVISNNAFYPFRKYVPDAETLIQYFEKNGYYTAGWGKIFHKNDSRTEPWDEYTWASGRPKPKKFPAHKTKILIDSIYRYFDWGPVDAPIEKWGEHKAAQGVIDFLKTKHDQPFFAAVGFRLPHLAWWIPPKFYKPFDNIETKTPNWSASDYDDIPDFVKNYSPKNEKGHHIIISNDLHAKAVKSYLAAIHYVDYELGRILNNLNESDQYKNTIVVIWSDHGFHLGEKMWWRKNSLWEESTRVPLMIRIPEKTKTALQTNHPVSLLDLYPTLVRLCGLPQKAGLDGQDISPLIINPEIKLKRNHVATTSEAGTSLRNINFRYTRYIDGSEELYDHNDDPSEIINLVNNPKYQNTLNAMQKLWFGVKTDCL
ncbi:sulfatase [Aquimarina celericrescens]|uniref:Sulfatase n=1 Tax=Aquimarina celericrescens TaxID=1964542 RepID=A0ABW5B0A5_9FLAO|nr:sulfatase [Aquimarina celericrescens]